MNYSNSLREVVCNAVIFCEENKRFLNIFPSRVYRVEPNHIASHEQIVESLLQDIRSNHLIDILKTI